MRAGSAGLRVGEREQDAVQQRADAEQQDGDEGGQDEEPCVASAASRRAAAVAAPALGGLARAVLRDDDGYGRGHAVTSVCETGGEGGCGGRPGDAIPCRATESEDSRTDRVGAMTSCFTGASGVAEAADAGGGAAAFARLTDPRSTLVMRRVGEFGRRPCRPCPPRRRRSGTRSAAARELFRERRRRAGRWRRRSRPVSPGDSSRGGRLPSRLVGEVRCSDLERRRSSRARRGRSRVQVSGQTGGTGHGVDGAVDESDAPAPLGRRDARRPGRCPRGVGADAVEFDARPGREPMMTIGSRLR